MAGNAVLAALVQRGITGRGQHLDVTLGEAATYTNEWAATELQPPGSGFGGFDTWNHRTYRLGDGSFVAILGNPVDAAERWAATLGGDDAVARLRLRSRLATRDARAADVPAVVAFLDELTSRYQGIDALESAAPDLLVAQVRSVAELAETEWAEQRGLFAEVRPGLRVPAAPWRSSGAEIGVGPLVSGLGADNRAALADWGVADGEIDALYASGALHAAVSED